MKKISYLFMFLLFLGSCKFVDTPYSFEREFDGGTYITPEGIVKYISGTPDSALTVSDNYAIIREEITYVKLDGSGINLDSILIFGHCYSEFPGPFACPVDSLITLERLQRYASIKFKGGGSKPESFITSVELDAGTTFESTFGLHYQTEYFIKSFVVTGRFKGGEPVYEHIAYNQNELAITTREPVDLWVGGTMLEAPASFKDEDYIGAVSFTYNGYMFIAQGHDEGPFDTHIVIHRYDPVSNSWDNPYDACTVNGGSLSNFTDAVAFVIEDAFIGNNNYRDCVYIGTGRKKNGGTTKRFYRLDLEQNKWQKITDEPDDPVAGAQDFPGLPRYNAIAFSINGIGYVGLGSLSNGDVLDTFFKYDPSDRSEFLYGEWTKIEAFPGGKRTKAVSFKLGDNVYISCGEDNGGVYKKDLRMCSQISGDWLYWDDRAEFPGTARIDAVGFNIGEMGYIGTGWDANAGDSARSDFYRYNPFRNEWEKKAYYGGAARFEAVGEGIKVGDNDYRGYIGTGWDGTDYYNDFWHYRP